MTTIFLKYRHKFADGPGDWEYTDLVVKSNPEGHTAGIEDHIHTLEEIYQSEHYRGIEYELVDQPPIDWIQEEIKAADRRIAVYTERKRQFSKLLRDLSMTLGAQTIYGPKRAPEESSND